MSAVDDFMAWFSRAKPGMTMTYYRGLSLAEQGNRDKQTRALQRAVFDLAVNGRLDLVQRRARAGFEYVAIMREKPHGNKVQPFNRYDAPVKRPHPAPHFQRRRRPVEVVG